jgi:hypothetical protein
VLEEGLGVRNGSKNESSAAAPFSPTSVKDEENAASDSEDDIAVRKKAEWLSMFNVTVRADMPRKFVHELKHEVAEGIAVLLRVNPTMPCHPEDPTKPWLDLQSGGRLPPVSCAFKGCTWCGGGSFPAQDLMVEPEHPWDQKLRRHVLAAHGDEIKQHAAKILTEDIVDDELVWGKLVWDLYKQALAVLERRGVPAVGPSVDRRTFEHVVQVYNDEAIKGLICFACAQIHVATGRCRTKIAFRTTSWLLAMSADALRKNFSMAVFEERYCCSGTPLAARGEGGPDFRDW